ncbi:MAG: class I SAM-dependent methyltransferase [Candidatus Babeliales bacterium]|nr:MAG: Methyltransferase type 11 [candidate division TM6 bacterium GW2011_GWF2_36_6]
MLNQVNKPEAKSIVFKWKPEDFDFLLKSCDFDDGVKITLKYLNDKDAKILEAGCGIGRVVKYLQDRGFTDVNGIEIDRESVDFQNTFFPELKITHADVLAMPYPDNFFDVILSYGVIEHFPDGPDAPLKAMYDVLKPGGIAIVTVPSFNKIRQMKYFYRMFDLRKYNFIRKFFGKKLLKKNGKRFSFYIDPQYGNFYEYRLTKKQFENICKRAGFQILESAPIAHIDGLFHEIGAPLVTFKDWKFKLSKSGKLLNKLFSSVPFLHNHMHACVLKKV